MDTDCKGKWALITGATAGIGEATAELLAEQGCHLMVTGRRERRLRDLASRLTTEHGVEVVPLVFDVSDRAAVEETLRGTVARLSSLDFLINNAGLAKGVESIQEGRMDDWERMIDTNVKGLLWMTRLCLPFFLRRGHGHIVNLGSVAGRWVYPGGAVYCASKFAVRALSEGLRLDLMGTPIRVTNIEPGMVETEFSVVRLQDEVKAKSVYRGFEPLQARDIAETIVWCLRRPAHVTVQELVIYPTAQAGVGPSYTARRTRREGLENE